MSLLQNQDFVIYRIRNRYLQCMKDGVGERLITVNPTVLNVPGFRNAGWGNPAEIRRTHSPPIPVGTSTEYFAAAPRSAGDLSGSFNENADDSLKAQKPSEFITRGDRIARRMREVTRDDDDSSDASDDSDDEETVIQGGSNQPKFPKRQLRTRSGSSPIRSGPQVLVTSPSSRPRDSRTRAGSHGTFDLTRGGGLDRISSDLIRPTVKNDVNNNSNSTALDDSLLSTRVRDADSEKFRILTERLNRSPASSFNRDRGLSFDLDDSAEDSDASTTLSSDFTETADSNPHVIGRALSTSIPMGLSSPSVLHALPPPRPISKVPPVSALTQLLKAQQQEAANPLEAFRTFSGKGELLQISLKVYFNKSKEPRKPLEVILRRITSRDTTPPKEIAVFEAIGFSLYRYIEEGRDPPLTEEQCDFNRWAFRMVEDDGEPDDDFPPLIRTRALTSYMVLGRRPADKLSGEFAMVEATPEQYKEHQQQTPNTTTPAKPKSTVSQTAPNPAGGLILAPSERQVATDSTSTRTGPSKILRVFINSIDEFAQSISLCITTDTYIGEVLEQVCKKKKLEKSNYVLKFHQQNVIAQAHRTVESLGENTDLDLVRRKLEKPGSPSNTSLLTNPIAPEKNGLVFHDGYQKFIVWRRQPMSFMSRHERILAIDGEYIHIMPSDQKTIFESPKTTSIHISSIIGCKVYKKAPTNFKIAVMKPQPREPKRYDFEAATAAQSTEIVAAVKKQIDTYKLDHPVMGV
ncbi:stress-activated map kinase interacting protein 1-domain-containing protein [Kalaharituber pfeilii]|nr:stress-activated map kinase interacting protein 1-domain-containing protein [Kalaharituber pfeilii]